jgi:DNA helicase-2/ATP-dependent DNA helicase PcrA
MEIRFVLNMIGGCVPSDLGTGTTAEIEEERRLLYVALTRAKDNFHVLVPQLFFSHWQTPGGDRHGLRRALAICPRRFAHALYQDNLACRCHTHAREPRPGTHNVRIDVAARMRDVRR